MRLLVAGPGAVGGFVAARLLDGGHDVTLLARQQRAEQLSKNGLVLLAGGERRVLEPGVVTAAEIGGPYDAVVLAVKAYSLDGVMRDIRPAVGDRTVIVPFLNGMGHIDRLREEFGSAVLGGVLRCYTQLTDDGAVEVIAPTFEVEIGAFDAESADAAQAVAGAFRDARADVVVRADIVAAMWAKWVFIASVGAITSLMRAPIGDVVAVDEGEEFARSIVAEAAGVAAAAGYPVPAEQVASIERTVTAAGSPVMSSLSRDLVAGRKTEVDAVVADLVRRGREFEVGVEGLGLASLALRVHNARLER
jgi:2-dehydropantoate 2-reductase